MRLAAAKGNLMGTLDAYLVTFLQWLVKATLQGSLLVCLIMLIQATLRQRLPARWRYCLWLVLLLRLSLPWSPQSPVSIYRLYEPLRRGEPAQPVSIRPPAQIPTNRQGQGIEQTHTGIVVDNAAAPRGAVEPAPDSGRRSSAVPSAQDGTTVVRRAGLLAALPGLWLIGVIGLGSYVLARSLWLWQAVVSERPVTDQQVLDLLEDYKMQMRVKTIVGVVVTDRTGSPALFGIIRPRILLPQGLLETINLGELQYVFLHELAHLKRRDIYLAWLVCVLQVLHWFNPLIWLAFRRMRIDQEMATDALALSTAGTDESRLYGQTIVNLVERFSRSQYVPSLAGILENPSHIERRMTMIAHFTKNSYRRSPLAVGLIIVLCCISLPNPGPGRAAASYAAEAGSTSVSRISAPLSLAGDSDTFTGPETGITFRKVTTLVGASDVIGWTYQLELSPNRRFLLEGQGLRVAPLDGGRPFDLVDLPGAQLGSWSPDGTKVAFWAGPKLADGAVWVVRVNPDTAQPTAPPEKLVECPFSYWLRWTPDSERIVFRRYDKGTDGIFWCTVSVGDGALTRITDFSTVGIPSPDGEDITYSENPTYTSMLAGPGKPMWVRSVKGGPARKIADAATPWCWSADGKWVCCLDLGSVVFIRMADGYEVRLDDLPSEVGSPIRSSLDGKKVYFYRTSEETRQVPKVVSTSGGPACEPGIGMKSFKRQQVSIWTPDSRAIITEGAWKGKDGNLWALRLAGGQPVPFQMGASVPPSRHTQRMLSPDCRNLLITASDAESAYGPWDVWVVPVSWQGMRTTGPAVLVLKGWVTAEYGAEHSAAWSSDGTKIALMDRRGSISVVPTTGGDPIRLTTGSGGMWLDWSPDGKRIAFLLGGPNRALQVIPSAGGEATTVCSVVPASWPIDILWSPDSQSLIMPRDQDIVSVSIADGSVRSLVNMKDVGKDKASVFHLSPDGTTLAFFSGLRSHTEGRHEDDQLFLLDMTSGKVSPLMPVGDVDVYDYRWSPDGRWIAYFETEFYKARSGSELWELDIAETLAELAK